MHYEHRARAILYNNLRAILKRAMNRWTGTVLLTARNQTLKFVRSHELLPVIERHTTAVKEQVQTRFVEGRVYVQIMIKRYEQTLIIKRGVQQF